MACFATVVAGFVALVTVCFSVAFRPAAEALEVGYAPATFASSVGLGVLALTLTFSFSVAFSTFGAAFASSFLSSSGRFEVQGLLGHDPAAEVAILVRDEVATLAIFVAAVAASCRRMPWLMWCHGRMVS